MDDVSNYEKLVEEEDELTTKIKLCEGCQWMLLDYISKNAGVGEEIGEEIMTRVHTIEQDLRTELMHLRLEKGILAGRMRGEGYSFN
jgi:hypothetical protein